MKLLSRVRLLAIPWAAAHQAPLSMGFSRQEYWSGVSSPSPMHESESEVAQSQIFLNIVYTHHFDDFTTIIRPTTGFFYIKL